MSQHHILKENFALSHCNQFLPINPQALINICTTKRTASQFFSQNFEYLKKCHGRQSGEGEANLQI